MKGTVKRVDEFAFSYWGAFCKYADLHKDFVLLFSKDKEKFREPSTNANLQLGSGANNSRYKYHVNMVKTRGEIRVELYTEDIPLYKDLFEAREHIEHKLGMALQWDALDAKKSSKSDKDKQSRCVSITHNFDLYDKLSWDEQFDWIISTLLKFHNALSTTSI